MSGTERGRAGMRPLDHAVSVERRAVSRNRELAAKYFGGASMAQIGAAFNRIDLDGRRALHGP